MHQIMKVTYTAMIASALLISGITPIGVSYASEKFESVDIFDRTGRVIDPETDRRTGETRHFTAYNSGFISGDGIFAGGTWTEVAHENIDYEKLIALTSNRITVTTDSGTATIVRLGKCDILSLTPPIIVSCTGLITVVSGTGAFSNLHGSGEYTSYVIIPGPTSYVLTGNYHFDP